MMRHITTSVGSAILGASLFLSLFLITSSVNKIESISSNLEPHNQVAQISGAGSGLVAHYTFDEGSGTTAGDSAGSNTGTLTNGPTWTTGKIGGALQFDGVDDKVNIGSISGTDFSFSTWVKSATPKSTCFIYAGAIKGLCTYSGSSYNVALVVNGSYFSGARASSFNLFDDNWHHIVGTETGSDTRIYVDGVLIGTATTAANSASASLNLGGDSGTIFSGIFSGLLDDVRIYNRALSASEVSELYAYTGGGTTPTPTAVNGSCGSTQNTCTTGTLNDTADTSTNYQWQCTGSNGGSTASCTLPIPSTPTDTTPPTISNIQSSSITTTGATITWTTNESADTQVEYGLTTAYGNTTSLNSSLVTSHSQSLSSLNPNTTYHYRVKSKDAAGNLTTSSDQTFMTSSVVTPPVSTSHIYIAQSQVGTGDASSCLNAKPVSFFNTSSNWGTGSSQIGPGKTVHLCGTISTTLTVQGSGTSGNPITILFEDGAKISMNAGTLMRVQSKNHIVIDGGLNGIIENTDNGSNLGNRIVSSGIYAPGTGNLEIKNLTIKNLYVHTSILDSDIDFTTGGGIYLNGYGSNISIHDNKFDHICWAIIGSGTTGSSNFNIYNNSFSNYDHAIGGIGGSMASPANVNIYNNHFGSTANWDTTKNTYHHDGIHIYFPGGGLLSGVKIFNNIFDGDWGVNNTAHIFLEGDWTHTNPSALSDFTIFNNVFIQNQNNLLNNGFVAGRGKNFSYLNNTFIGAGVRNSRCVSAGGEGFKFINNIVIGCTTLLNLNSGGLFDNNIYSNLATGGTSPWILNSISYNSFADWKNASLGENNSISTQNLQIPNDGKIELNSPAINAGANLSQYFTTDILGNSRGSTWDIGAYEYTGAVVNPTTYTITASIIGQGTLSATGLSCTASTCTATPSTGSSVTITATPSTGYTFTGWSGSCTGTSTCTLSSAGTVTATFTTTVTPDTTLPTVSLTSPTGTISGTVTLAATAADNVGVVGVQFKLDGVNIGQELTTAPYSGAWNTLNIADGTHTLTATARDAAGNSRTSNPVSIFVNNNTAPVLATIGSKTVVAGTQLSFSILATDAQNNTLTYTAPLLPQGASFSNRTFTWTPTTAGTYSARFNVSDGILSDSETITITVTTPLPVDQDTDGDGVSNLNDKCPFTPIELRNEVNIYGCPKPRITKFTLVPDPATTDISTSLSSLDISNAYGKITYATPVNLYRDQTTYKTQLDIDSYLDITSGTVSLGSSSLPELNKTATVTLYNITYQQPRILKDGVVCTSCTLVSYTNNTYVFRVTGFSTYTIEEGAETTTTTTTTGGGGGGGGGSSSSTTRYPTGTLTPTVTQIPVSATQQVISEPSSIYAGLLPLTRNLYKGLRGEDVRNLQRFLVIEGLLTIDEPTTYYGSQTEAAVKLYQAKNNIVSVGSPATTGYGAVGPKTKASINQKIGSLPTTTISTPQTSTITLNLYKGLRHQQVATLQTYLKQKGYLDIDTVTTYYGSLTEAAVKKFQCATLSICSGTPDTNGYGRVGPKTRSVIK